jgi:hypothetical protein
MLGRIARANRAVSGVTQAILDQGVVMAFVKKDSVSVTSPADGPYKLPTNWSVGAVLVDYRPTVGRIMYFNQNLTGTSVGFAFTQTAGFFFRHVLIPGGVAGGRFMSGPAAGMAVEDVRRMSYKEFIKTFGVPEHGSNE